MSLISFNNTSGLMNVKQIQCVKIETDISNVLVKKLEDLVTYYIIRDTNAANIPSLSSNYPDAPGDVEVAYIRENFKNSINLDISSSLLVNDGVFNTPHFAMINSYVFNPSTQDGSSNLILGTNVYLTNPNVIRKRVYLDSSSFTLYNGRLNVTVTDNPGPFYTNNSEISSWICEFDQDDPQYNLAKAINSYLNNRINNGVTFMKTTEDTSFNRFWAFGMHPTDLENDSFYAGPSVFFNAIDNHASLVDSASNDLYDNGKSLNTNGLELVIDGDRPANGGGPGYTSWKESDFGTYLLYQNDPIIEVDSSFGYGDSLAVANQPFATLSDKNNEATVGTDVPSSLTYNELKDLFPSDISFNAINENWALEVNVQRGDGGYYFVVNNEESIPTNDPALVLNSDHLLENFSYMEKMDASGLWNFHSIDVSNGTVTIDISGGQGTVDTRDSRIFVGTGAETISNRDDVDLDGYIKFEIQPPTNRITIDSSNFNNITESYVAYDNHDASYNILVPTNNFASPTYLDDQKTTNSVTYDVGIIMKGNGYDYTVDPLLSNTNIYDQKSTYLGGNNGYNNTSFDTYILSPGLETNVYDITDNGLGVEAESKFCDVLYIDIANTLTSNEILHTSDANGTVVGDTSFNASVVLHQVVMTDYSDNIFRILLNNRYIEEDTSLLLSDLSWNKVYGDGVTWLKSGNLSKSVITDLNAQAMLNGTYIDPISGSSEITVHVEYNHDSNGGNGTFDYISVWASDISSNVIKIYQNEFNYTERNVDETTELQSLTGLHIREGNPFISNLNQINVKKLTRTITFDASFTLPMKPYTNLVIETPTLVVKDTFYEVYRAGTSQKLNSQIVYDILNSEGQQVFVPPSEETWVGDSENHHILTITVTRDDMHAFNAQLQATPTGGPTNWQTISGGNGYDQYDGNFLLDPFFSTNSQDYLGPNTLSIITSINPESVIQQPQLPLEWYVIPIENDIPQTVNVVSRRFTVSNSTDNYGSMAYFLLDNNKQYPWLPSYMIETNRPNAQVANTNWNSQGSFLNSVENFGAIDLEYTAEFDLSDIDNGNTSIVIRDSSGNEIARIKRTDSGAFYHDIVIISTSRDWFESHGFYDQSESVYFTGQAEADTTMYTGSQYLSIDSGVALLYAYRDANVVPGETLSITLDPDRCQCLPIINQSFNLTPTENSYTTMKDLEMTNGSPIYVSEQSTSVKLKTISVQYVRGYSYMGNGSNVDTQVYDIIRTPTTAIAKIRSGEFGTEVDYALINSGNPIFSTYETGNSLNFNTLGDIGLNLLFNNSIIDSTVYDAVETATPNVTYGRFIFKAVGDYVELRLRDNSNTWTSYDTTLLNYHLNNIVAAPELLPTSFPLRSKMVRISNELVQITTNESTNYSIYYNIGDLTMSRSPQTTGDPRTFNDYTQVVDISINNLRNFGYDIFNLTADHDVQSYHIKRVSPNAVALADSYFVIARPSIAFSAFNNNAVQTVPYTVYNADRFLTRYESVDISNNIYTPFSADISMNNITFYESESDGKKSYSNYINNPKSDGNGFYIEGNFYSLTDYRGEDYSNVLVPHGDGDMTINSIASETGGSVDISNQLYSIKYQQDVALDPWLDSLGNMTVHIDNAFVYPGSTDISFNTSYGNVVNFIGAQTFMDTGAEQSLKIKMYKYSTGTAIDLIGAINNISDKTTPLELGFFMTKYYEKVVDISSIVVGATKFNVQDQLNKITMNDIDGLEENDWVEQSFTSKKINFNFIPMTYEGSDLSTTDGYASYKRLLCPGSDSDVWHPEAFTLCANYFSLDDIMTIKNAIGIPVFRITYNGMMLSTGVSAATVAINESRSYNADAATVTDNNTNVFSEFNVNNHNQTLYEA